MDVRGNGVATCVGWYVVSFGASGDVWMSGYYLGLAGPAPAPVAVPVATPIPAAAPTVSAEQAYAKEQCAYYTAQYAAARAQGAAAVFLSFIQQQVTTWCSLVR
ncbi:MAG: hypothetical protein EXR64_04705 [Dehalococcoidia bacterium]|nr:hypothetical protein [Dehalococcoidia bacterium]